MTYEEVCAEWVRRRYQLAGEISDVKFEINPAVPYGGCDTCGYGADDNAIEITWRTDKRYEYRELNYYSFPTLLAELVNIANEAATKS